MDPLAPLLRPYRPGDAADLAAVYREAVRGLGPQGYAPVQVEAWSRYPESLEEFRERLARGLTLVAEAEGNPLAFAQLDPADHVAFLYTSPGHARRGLASLLYAALESRARAAGTAVLRTEASRLARPFFARQGFSVVTAEYPERHGVVFERFRMAKRIA